jgi:enoyl-CoA hydratase/carnithine racemase
MLIKEERGAIRVLRLANPPANVLNMSLLATLEREIASAGSDPAIRCVVLSSAYPRYFSMGLDLEEMLSLPQERRSEVFGGLLSVYHGLRACPKPSLAAISGSAFLGGWILAMGCDFRLLSAGTGRIALAEIRMGLSPGAELIARLREISSSPVLVKELVLRGKTLRAEEALAGGFVDALFPPESLEDEAMKEARQLCKLPLEAYAAIKRALSGPPGDREALWQDALAEFRLLMRGADAQEGVLAMREKRRPRFAGAEAVGD